MCFCFSSYSFGIRSRDIINEIQSHGIMTILHDTFQDLISKVNNCAKKCEIQILSLTSCRKKVSQGSRHLSYSVAVFSSCGLIDPSSR